MITNDVTTEAAKPGLLVRLGDGVIAAAFVAVIIVEIWAVADLPWSRWNQILATLMAPVLAGPLLFRSVRPFPAYVVNAAAIAVMMALGYESDVYQWANLILLLSVSMAFRGRESTIALLSGLGLVAYFFATFRPDELTPLVMVLTLWFVVWLLGRMQGARQVETQLRHDRDVAAELAATRATRLDLEAQRTTMARELHDLIGHTVNVMVVHAGAGRLAVGKDPDGAKKAFETIESTGRSALDELDRVLGILRTDDPDAPLAPLPGIGALPALLDEVRGAGLDVNLSTSGQVDSLPAGIGLTIYRVVQEALTNTLKHGEASRSDVSISVDHQTAHVLAIDDGAGGEPSGNMTAVGRGLVGITERVQLHGGSATFDSPGTGFRVECTIPLTLETSV